MSPRFAVGGTLMRADAISWPPRCRRLVLVGPLAAVGAEEHLDQGEDEVPVEADQNARIPFRRVEDAGDGVVGVGVERWVRVMAPSLRANGAPAASVFWRQIGDSMIEEGFVRMYAHDFAALAARAEGGSDVEALVRKRIDEARSHALLSNFSQERFGHICLPSPSTS
eukprot:gene4214-5749_t